MVVIFNFLQNHLNELVIMFCKKYQEAQLLSIEVRRLISSATSKVNFNLSYCFDKPGRTVAGRFSAQSCQTCGSTRGGSVICLGISALSRSLLSNPLLSRSKIT